MTEVLKTAMKQLSERDDMRERCHQMANTFMTHRQCGEAEAIYKLLASMPLSYSSVATVFVPTQPKGMRRQFLQRQDPDSGTGFAIDGREGKWTEKPDLISKYERRKVLPPRGQEDKKDKGGQDAESSNNIKNPEKDKGGQDAETARNNKNLEKDKGGQDDETARNNKNLEKDKGGQDAETARNNKNLEKDKDGQDDETARTNKNLEKDKGGQDAETARTNKNLEKDKGGQHTKASNNNQNPEDSEAAKIVEQMCFAQFIRMYESRTWQQKRKTNDEGEAEQSDSDGEERLDEGQLAIEDDFNYLITGEEENSRRKIPHLLTLKSPLPGEPTIFQKRTFPRALRFFKNKADKAPHMFFFSQLILYHPFRDENELFPEDPEKCEELYNTHKKEILMRKARIMPYLESVEEAQAMYEERKAKEETNIEDAVGADLDPQMEQEAADGEDVEDEDHPDFIGMDPDLLDINPEEERRPRKVFKTILLPSKDHQVKYSYQQTLTFYILLNTRDELT